MGLTLEIVFAGSQPVASINASIVSPDLPLSIAVPITSSRSNNPPTAIRLITRECLHILAWARKVVIKAMVAFFQMKSAFPKGMNAAASSHPFL